MRFLCSACRTILTGEPGQEVECRLCKTMCKAPESAMAPGAVIGDFAIVRELARGGMGIVYLARQISLDRLVALKILQEKYAADSQFVEDFIREARAAARISHPNIVQAYAVGEENGIYYFAMELIDGDTMKGVLKKEQKIAPRKAAEIIRSIADALDFAWTEQKIVHQDIKPDNIMLTRRGQAKLADLGLSRMATGSLDLNADDDEVMGTPQYISPEQLTGMPTDIRSDIYSLGATFYHLVTGEFPYQGKDGNEIARQHVEGTLIPPIEKQPDLPPELNRIIVKMMAKTLEERYQTGAELVDDLKNFLQGTPAAATGKEEKPAPALNVKQTPPLNKTAAPALNAAPAPKLNTAAAPALNAAPAPKLNTAAAPALNAAPAPKLNTAAAPALNAA
ncbi:MAG: serine/threonine protein kinase, partial [Lentisphaeria bacterium]|nr:serine/threonine protein kinase [Lentisphaeria bacterium]